jgi:hypothetical protein
MWRVLLSVTVILIYLTYGYVVLSSSKSIVAKFWLLMASLPNLLIYVALVAFFDQMPKSVRTGVGAVALILTALVLALIKTRRPKIFASLQLMIGFGSAAVTCSTLEPSAPVTLAQTVALFGIVSLIITGYIDLFKKDDNAEDRAPFYELADKFWDLL